MSSQVSMNQRFSFESTCIFSSPSQSVTDPLTVIELIDHLERCGGGSFRLIVYADGDRGGTGGIESGKRDVGPKPRPEECVDVGRENIIPNAADLILGGIEERQRITPEKINIDRRRAAVCVGFKDVASSTMRIPGGWVSRRTRKSRWRRPTPAT